MAYVEQCGVVSSMCNEIIAILFLSRDIAHREHLKTTSYAAHVALQEFYEGIIPLADDLAETYQGVYGQLKTIPYLKPEGAESIDDELEFQLEEVESLRYDIFKKDETALQNIVDEIVALYMRTLYKLRRFK
jgi:hypothetical protein